MTTLTNNLPTLEELRFRQAGHSTVECSLRTHCTICHSKAHSVEQCEYNLLNKSTATVRQIQSYQDNQERYNSQSHDENR